MSIVVNDRDWELRAIVMEALQFMGFMVARVLLGNAAEEKVMVTP